VRARREPPLAFFNLSAVPGILIGASGLAPLGTAFAAAALASSAALAAHIVAVGMRRKRRAGRTREQGGALERQRERRLASSARLVEAPHALVMIGVLVANCVAFALATRLLIERHARAAERAAGAAPTHLEGMVIRFSPRGFDILSDGHRVRVYLSSDQIMKRNLARLVRTQNERMIFARVCGNENPDIYLYQPVLFEWIAVKRTGRARPATRLTDAASGTLYTCTGRLLRVPGTRTPRLDESGQDRSSVPSNIGHEGNTSELSDAVFRALIALERTLWRGIDARLDGEEAGLCKAVLSGDYNHLSDARLEAFRRCGLAHVIAISGQHIAIVFGFVLLCSRFLRIPRSSALVLAIVLAAFFVPLSGFAASAIRSWVMALVLMVAGLLGRNSQIRDAAHASAAAFLVTNPLALFDASFALSFACVLSLIYLYPIAAEWLRMVVPTLSRSIAFQMVLASSIVTAGLAPLTASLFGQTPFLGVLANLPAVPAASILTIASIPVGLGEGTSARIAGIVAALSARTILSAADACARLRHASLTLSPAEAFLGLALGTVVFWRMSATRVKRMQAETATTRNVYIHTSRPGAYKGSFRMRVAVGALVVAFMLFELAPPRAERLVFFDVGQGNATLVASRQAAMLFDSGPPGVQIGARLCAERVRVLDIVVLSHSHLDHAGGLARLLDDRGVSIHAILIPDTSSFMNLIASVARRKKIHVLTPEQGESYVRAGDITLTLFNPVSVRRTSSDRSNEVCMIARATLARSALSALLLADAPIDVQEDCRLCRLPAEVVLLSHHGSRADYDPRVIDRCAPALVVISVGPNCYGHPSDAVIRDIRRRGIRLLLTKEVGDIEVRAQKQ
jgi:competence protein ComEC